MVLLYIRHAKHCIRKDWKILSCFSGLGASLHNMAKCTKNAEIIGKYETCYGGLPQKNGEEHWNKPAHQVHSLLLWQNQDEQMRYGDLHWLLFLQENGSWWYLELYHHFCHHSCLPSDDWGNWKTGRSSTIWNTASLSTQQQRYFLIFHKLTKSNLSNIRDFTRLKKKSEPFVNFKFQ